MSQTYVLKALGLVTSPNDLDRPPGSLDVASNVIIKRDGVIEPRRGFPTYGTTLGGNAKQLLSYQNRILRHYGVVLDFDSDGEGTFTSFTGSYSEPESGIRIKSVEANGNLYFTTSDGIKKISASSTEDLEARGIDSGFITSAGGLKALNSEVFLNYTPGNQTGWFTEDSAVSYRVVLGTIDANDSLILGFPSEKVDIYNSLLTLMLEDYNRLLLALDNVVRTDPQNLTITTTSRLGAAGSDNYMSDTTSGKVLTTDSATTLRSHIIALGTKLDDRITLAISGGTPATATRQRTSTTSGIIVFNNTMVNYIRVGDIIVPTLFSGAGTPGDWNNNLLTVTDVTTTTVTITPATAFTGTDGAPVADTGGTVKRSKYSNTTVIPQPGVPSTNPTNDQLNSIQSYLNSFITTLQTELTGIITSASQTAYITPLAITTTTTTTLNITIPEEATTDYFIQVYRSKMITATGTAVLADLTPFDELQLAYEAYLTSTEITNRLVTITDVTPESLLGAFLYTNESSAEGIDQANDIPPLSEDIANYKNYTFYANTSTKERLTLTLLGVSNMVSDYNGGTIPKFMITNEDNITNTYSFTLGKKESTNITCVADVANSLNGTYFLLDAADDIRSYYVWYKTSGAAVSDPAVAGRTGIRVNLTTGDAASVVAQKTGDTLNGYNNDFITSYVGAVLTITNVDYGYTTDIAAGTSGFGPIVVTQQGQGEKASTKEIFLSPNASVGQAVDETIRSLQRIVNQNNNDIVYVYYLFDPEQTPGKILLETRSLSSPTFYVLGNNSNTGTSFSPSISPKYSGASLITLSTTNGNGTIVTSAAHGLTNGDYVLLINTSTANIDGYHQITFINATSFSITTTASATLAGIGAMLAAEDSNFSDNEVWPNRLYYSKLQQPEAVPLLNYLNVGAKNKAILRIVSLRDSLFIFKEDGTYRLSGEIAPFVVDLLDSSFVVIAPDSVAVADNLIFAWVTRGIYVMSESGQNNISRLIDRDIKILSASIYPNFRTITWGAGYESDNAYYVGVALETSDTKATVIYRYSTLTESWTTFDISATCGLVLSFNDLLYLGAGDTNRILKERKTFTRTDHSDREINTIVNVGSYNSDTKILSLPSLTNINIGDVITQEQSVTVYKYNTLLKQLDLDTSIPSNDYYTTLKAKGGDNLRLKLTNISTPTGLAQKLDTELTLGYASLIADKLGTITANTIANPTVVTSVAHGLQTGRIVTITGSNSTPSIDGTYEVTVLSANTFSIPVNVTVAGTTGNFLTVTNDIRDLKTCFNLIIDRLNNDTLVNFMGYLPITDNTIFEAVIIDVNNSNSTVTLNYGLDFVEGDIIIYNSILSRVVWDNITFDDPINFKHLREASVFFENKAFTQATLGFKTDLFPEITQVSFTGDGNGIFGTPNFGSNFFGGNSNSAPFRTYIPRNYQRCRFINLEFTHNIAREAYSLLGVSITGHIRLSERAYKR